MIQGLRMNQPMWETSPRPSTHLDTNPSQKESKHLPRKVLDPEVLHSSLAQATLSPESADRMECFVQFMARRELITNEIEIFDNSLENYNIWRYDQRRQHHRKRRVGIFGRIHNWWVKAACSAVPRYCSCRKSSGWSERVWEKIGLTVWIDCHHHSSAPEQTDNKKILFVLILEIWYSYICTAVKRWN